jgi:hypothetical protein
VCLRHGQHGRIIRRVEKRKDIVQLPDGSAVKVGELPRTASEWLHSP